MPSTGSACATGPRLGSKAAKIPPLLWAPYCEIPRAGAEPTATASSPLGYFPHRRKTTTSGSSLTVASGYQERR